MYMRISIPLFALTLLATPLLGQAPEAPTAAEPVRSSVKPLEATTNDLSSHINDRLQFMRKMYTLDEAQLAQARADMMTLADEHNAYMELRETTLRRLSKAILFVLPNQLDISDAQRETIRQSFQRQIYRIHTRSPLSYAHVAKRVEKSLGKDQIDQGRKQIASSFASQLAGAAVDLDKLDTLAIPPLKPTAHVAATTPTRPTHPSAKPPARTPPSETPDHPPHPGHEAHANLPPPPKGNIASLQEATPIVAAPPVAEWPARMTAATTRYGFSPQQAMSAESVLASCRTRAEAHLAARKADYEKVNQLADSEAKSKQLAALNREVDVLYHEMNQRIDSIASIEQRLASQGAASKAVPAEKKQPTEPPAKKIEEKKTAATPGPGK